MKQSNELLQKKYYDSIAHNYEAIDGRRKKHFKALKIIIQNLATITPAKTFLDVGAGTGYISKLAANHFKQVVAIDISQKMLDQINDNRIATICMPFKDMDIWESQFDVVCCFATLHHIEEIPRLIQLCYKVLKPNGILYTDHDMDDYFYQKNKIFVDAYRKITNRPQEAEFHNNGIPSTAIAEYVKSCFGHVALFYHWEGFIPFLKPSTKKGSPLVRMFAAKKG